MPWTTVVRGTYVRVLRSFWTSMEHLLCSATEIATFLRSQVQVLAICDGQLGGWVIASSRLPAVRHSRPAPAQISSLTKLERDVQKLEEEGKLEEVMSKLLKSHSEGSSDAGILAHELAQRHPEALRTRGCPMHQSDKKLAATTSSVTKGSDDPVVAPSQTRSSLPSWSVVNTQRPRHAAPVSAADTKISHAVDARAFELRHWTTQHGQESGELTAAATEPSHVSPESNARAKFLAGQALDSETDEEANGDDGIQDADVESFSPDDPVRPVRATAAKGDKEGGETPWKRGWQASDDFEPPSEGKLLGSAEVGDFAPGLRNFTLAQLNAFDGGIEKGVERGGIVKAGKTRPIYIALRGKVYDASAGRHLYGPGGEYSELAGHDVSKRVARGLRQGSSRENGEGDLDDISLEGLSRFEEMTLAGWEDIFLARGYPVVGRVVAIATPTPPRLFSREELRMFDGRSVAVELPDGFSLPGGYAVPPIYVGLMDKVFDVSFGGSEFYSGGGAYECLAGRDASRVLAKMSMSPEDVGGLLDYSRLTTKEIKNLIDWGKRFENKGYPAVGRLELCGLSCEGEAQVWL